MKQKNQLEIEKSEIEKKYKTLVDEHDNLIEKIGRNCKIGKKLRKKKD